MFAIDAIANFVTVGLEGGVVGVGRCVAVGRAEDVGGCFRMVEEDIPSVRPSGNDGGRSHTQIPQEETLAPLCTSTIMAKNRDSAETGLNTM